MSDCKCQTPCSPCEKCPEDGEITEVQLLDADECSGPCGGCCWTKCNDNHWINIQSTNECLQVDTSECWVVKLTAACPPIVAAWENVTVDTLLCDCTTVYVVNAECEDEKVKACSWDTSPWYLDNKIVAWDRIHIETVWCDWADAHLVISADECPTFEYPELEVQWSSQLIKLRVWWPDWHTIYLTDRAQETYYNMVCVWFKNNKDVTVRLDGVWNATKIERVNEWWSWWDVFTWNGDMATHNGIKILESWYYRVFGQLTVQNNVWVTADQYYINLWRAFLRIKRWGNEIYLSTAKHWSYGRQVLLTWGTWINVSDSWVISVAWGSFHWSWTAPEWGWTVTISGNVTYPSWSGQTNNWFDWPWMTFNIDAYVDLYKNDVITLWYRPQSDMASAQNQNAYFRFTWANDTTTEFERVFGWSILWANLVTPHLFQSTTANKIYWDITH